MKKNITLFIMTISVCLMCLGCGKADDAYKKGMKLAEALKYEKSLPYFEEAIREDDGQGDYYLSYGMTLNHIEKYDDAKQVFLKVLKKDILKESQKKQVYYGLGLAYFGLGEFKSTIKYVDKALKMDVLEDMDEEISYTKIVSYDRLGEYSKARNLCESILKNNEKNIDVYREKASLEQKLEDASEAQNTYKKAIKIMPEEYDLYFELYHIYIQNDQSDAAYEVLKPLLELKTDSEKEMIAKGRACLYGGNADAALEQFDAAYEKGDVQALFYQGEVARERAETEDAKALYEKYLAESKEEILPIVYVRQAEIYLSERNYEAGKKAIHNGLSLGVTEVTRELQRLQVIVCEKQGDYHQAKSYAKAYLLAYPDDQEMIKEKKFIATRIK